jgi:hypothetical protein
MVAAIKPDRMHSCCCPTNSTLVKQVSAAIRFDSKVVTLLRILTATHDSYSVVGVDDAFPSGCIPWPQSRDGMAVRRCLGLQQKDARAVSRSLLPNATGHVLAMGFVVAVAVVARAMLLRGK